MKLRKTKTRNSSNNDIDYASRRSDYIISGCAALE